MFFSDNFRLACTLRKCSKYAAVLTLFRTANINTYIHNCYYTSSCARCIAGLCSTGDQSQATLTPSDGELCPLWLAAISVVLYRCPTGPHCLHGCTRNSPLTSSALHRTHFDPSHPVDVGGREEGQAFLNLWRNSHFLSGSCFPPIKKCSSGWNESLHANFFVAPPLFFSLRLEFVYATGWYRNCDW